MLHVHTASSRVFTRTKAVHSVSMWPRLASRIRAFLLYSYYRFFLFVYFILCKRSRMHFRIIRSRIVDRMLQQLSPPYLGPQCCDASCRGTLSKEGRTHHSVEPLVMM
jgi:hypothetical protein